MGAIGVGHEPVVYGEECPGEVGEDGDEVHVDVVVHGEAHEGAEECSEEGGGRGDVPTAEEGVPAEEEKGVGNPEFEGECGVEGEKAVEEEVPGMEEADLAFAEKVEAVEDMGHPEEGVAVL